MSEPGDIPLQVRLPAWSTVWHRGDSRRGIVCGWGQHAGGNELVLVDWGGGGSAWEYAGCLQDTDPEKDFDVARP